LVSYKKQMMQQDFHKEAVKRAENPSLNLQQFGDKPADARLKAQQISDRAKEQTTPFAEIPSMTDTARAKLEAQQKGALQSTADGVPDFSENRIFSSPLESAVHSSNLFSSMESKPLDKPVTAIENKPFSMDKPFVTSSFENKPISSSFHQDISTIPEAPPVPIGTEFTAGVAGATQGAKEVIQEKAAVVKEKGSEALATVQGFAQDAAETAKVKGNQFLEGAAGAAHTAKEKGSEAIATVQGAAQGAAETIKEKGSQFVEGATAAAQTAQEKGSEALLTTQRVAHGAAETVKEKGHQFVEGATEAAHTAKEKGSEALTTAQNITQGAIETVKEKSTQLYEGAAGAAEAAKEKAHVVAEEAKGGAQSFADQVADKAHDVSEYAKHLGESAKESAVSFAETVRVKAHEVVETLGETGEKVKESVESAAHSVHDFFVPQTSVAPVIPVAPPVPTNLEAASTIRTEPRFGLSLAEQAELKMDQATTKLKEGEFKLRSEIGKHTDFQTEPSLAEKADLKMDQARIAVKEKFLPLGHEINSLGTDVTLQERMGRLKRIREQAKAKTKLALGSKHPLYQPTNQERMDEMESAFRRL